MFSAVASLEPQSATGNRGAGQLDRHARQLTKKLYKSQHPCFGRNKNANSDHAWFLQPWLPPLLTCQRHRAALKVLLFTLAVVLCRLFLPVHRLEKCGHGSAYISGDALLIHLRSLDEISRLHSLTAHQKRACLNRQPLTTVRSNHSCVD